MNRSERRRQARKARPPGHPSNCDFCGASVDRTQLWAWPCASFEMQFLVHDQTGYYVCACHTRTLVPAGAVLCRTDAYVGSWAACPPCRADVDAERWAAIDARHAGRSGLPAVPAGKGPFPDNLIGMFVAHRTPPGAGSWQPATAALVDAEIALFGAQKGAR